MGSDDVLPIYLAELDTQEDKDKFAELYEKYSRKMYHIALSILKNPADAEDAVDIVFSRLANKFTEISQKSNKLSPSFIKNASVSHVKNFREIYYIEIFAFFRIQGFTPNL